MRRLWTPADDRLLTELYPFMPAKELAARLDRNIYAIYRRCWHLKLSKSPEFLASVASGRLNGSQGAETRFKPGHVPWTRGRLGLRLAEGSEFKPGHRPHNWRPVGTIVTASIGYMTLKIAEPNFWCLLHQFEWMRVHGPIPKGYSLRFIDGDKTNCTADNVCLVSRRDVMHANAIHRMPKELQDLSRLKGQIVKKINRIEKDKEASNG